MPWSGVPIPDFTARPPQVKAQFCHVLCDLEPLLSVLQFSLFAKGDNGSPVLIGFCESGVRVGWGLVLGCVAISDRSMWTCSVSQHRMCFFLRIVVQSVWKPCLTLEDSGTQTLANAHGGFQAWDRGYKERARSGVCISFPLLL